jgi:hypothetical protein
VKMPKRSSGSSGRKQPAARVRAVLSQYRSLEGALGAAWRSSKDDGGASWEVWALGAGGYVVQRPGLIPVSAQLVATVAWRAAA